MAIAEDDSVAHRTRYRWGGGQGTLWYSWPDQRIAAVLFTQVLSPSPELLTAFTAGVETVLNA